jgi:hypothetical protein
LCDAKFAISGAVLAEQMINNNINRMMPFFKKLIKRIKNTTGNFSKKY